MKIKAKEITGILVMGLFMYAVQAQQAEIPLPEHPRPDFQRQEWQNLNGVWNFVFDKEARLETPGFLQQPGLTSGQFQALEISVPFPWGSPLSGVPDSADIGWYQREIRIPGEWSGRRVFLVLGACDWHTKVWIDGQYIGEHKGGYTPFEFELTGQTIPGDGHSLLIRVDDSEHSFKLYGKQGYGNARGIWQTVYLEARGINFLDYVHVTPDIDKGTITITGALDQPATGKAGLKFKILDEDRCEAVHQAGLKTGSQKFSFTYTLEDPVLWTLEAPHLYDLTVSLREGEKITDQVNTYFGMRKISVMDLPGTDYPYVALNNKPIYLEMSLDQAYHPGGFYTFPTDDFMRDEILRSKKIGLNGQRIHVKIGIPRKLYWADKLGMLIMADVPNSWGEPDKNMRHEIEYALRQMIKRDYNHPSIFSWVVFNETWGLFTRKDDDQRDYLKATQNWVADMYHLAKELDPSRLVEDNSACNYDHVVTDLNTWHAYLPGYAWEERLDQFSRETFPGSEWNFVEGYSQSDQPNINSECGNVWGYTGSTGDVDWSWDYHLMINAFRKHPKIGGWLYTEHHDVINEWNGYFRYDRSEKNTGLEAFNGMTLTDLHAPIQITPDIALCVDKKPGDEVEISLWLSVFTDELPAGEVRLLSFLTWTDEWGEEGRKSVDSRALALVPWQQGPAGTLKVTLPEIPGLAVLHTELQTEGGYVFHRNFTTFRIKEEEREQEREGKQAIRIVPDSYREAEWSLKTWRILDGLKVNGAGNGYFLYDIKVPEGIETEKINEIIFLAEISAKKLHGKDKIQEVRTDGDYMRGRGLHDPSQNPNAYPMTDEKRFPSLMRISMNGHVIGEFFLEDDPADHRGVLSWHAQPRDRKLREAGSYGYLVKISLPEHLIPVILAEGSIKLKLEVPEGVDGGLAIYGKDFGRYPVDPMLIFKNKK